VYAIATFVFVAVVSMIFTRLATGALIATGLPDDIARFQARSAITGTGFTTTESENLVNHPVRRRVLYTVMLVGNLGTPTLVITVVLGFVAPGPGDTSERLISMLVGLILILAVLSSRPVSRRLEDAGSRYAKRRLLRSLADHAEELLDLGDGFVVSRIPLVDTPADAVRSLRALRQHLPGLEVLGLRRDREGETSYLGRGPTDIDLEAGDALVVYGRREAVTRLTDPAS
jgi:hypothetical protein